MSNFTECLLFIFIVCHVLQGSFALYEDQIGKFDWRQKYIGFVNNAIFDTKSAGRKVVVATDQNIVAALDPRDGSLLWRQLYESEDRGVINYFSQKKDIITISGSGKYLRFWDMSSGTIAAEHSLPFQDTNVHSLYSYNANSHTAFRIELHQNSHIVVHSFNTKDDEYKSEQVSTPWLKSHSWCVIVAEETLICADVASKSLFLFNLMADKISFETYTTASLQKILPDIKNFYVTTNDLLVLKTSISTFVLEIKSSKVSKTIDIGPGIVYASTADLNGDVIIVCIKKGADDSFDISAKYAHSAEDIPSLSNQLQLPQQNADILKVWIHMFMKKDGNLGYRMMLSLSDHSLIMVNYLGKTMWTREEALATILSVEMLELPVSDTEARFEEEFGAADGNIVSMFIQRLTTQCNQLLAFCDKLVTRVLSGHVTSPEQQIRKLVRDEFNLHKIIVVATSAGKLFGLDNLSGTILWKKFIVGMTYFDSNDKRNMALFVQRTTAHFPHKPQCALLGVHKESGNSMLYFFEPMTGQPAEDTGHNAITHLGSKAIQATVISFHDNHFLKPIIILDAAHKVHVFPSSAISVVQQNCKSHYMFAADPKTGFVTGFSFQHSTNQEVIASKMWQMVIPIESQQITHVVTKRAIERVHSQGRVMGDRSVLYKYLNPNLAVIVTKGTDSNLKPFMTLYLIDGVTGQIVHSIIHRRAHGPIHVVHSENWVVYSYFNEKSRRTDLGVLEMYEGKTQSNTTVFSSLHPPLMPIVEKQAYIFPMSGIYAMADTVTEKGMTSKHVLVALPNGGILEIPKFFLDPRRPIQMTAELREEGLMPYIPELPIPAEHIINYNQSLAKVRGIYTAPSGLESTCLVFAYGIDLYYTRITPSKTFDVLKDDFDHYLITLVLLGLILASYITKRLAAHKALKQAWK